MTKEEFLKKLDEKLKENGVKVTLLSLIKG